MHARNGAVGNMGVIERGADVIMSQQFLNQHDIGPKFQQMRSVTVSETVDAKGFSDPGFVHCDFEHRLCASDGILAATLPFEKVSFRPISFVVDAQFC